MLVVRAGDRWVHAEADDLEIRAAHGRGQRTELLARRAVPLHRRRQLDEDAPRPALERPHVGERADGQDRPGVVRRAQRRGQHHRPRARGQIVELVDRPDGDDVAQRHRDLRQGSATEPVAVAFHDRHQAGSVTGHPIDALTPRGAVDRQPQRHDNRR